MSVPGQTANFNNPGFYLPPRETKGKMSSLIALCALVALGMVIYLLTITNRWKPGLESVQTDVKTLKTQVNQLQPDDEWKEYKGSWYDLNVLKAPSKASDFITLPDTLLNSDGDLLPKLKQYLKKSTRTISFAYMDDKDVKTSKGIFTLNVPGYFFPGSQGINQYTIYSLY